MACYPIQCFVPPCPQVCDDGAIGGTSITAAPYVNTTLPYRNIDPALLITGPKSLPRQPGTYTGGSYPSTDPDFRVETESLDYWRLVLLALGIVIGAIVIKRS